MSKKKQARQAAPEAEPLDSRPAESAGEAPGQAEQRQGFWKVGILIWGLPLLLVGLAIATRNGCG